MLQDRTITILHVSDMQFGRNHRFGRLQLPPPDDQFDTLLARLGDDVKLLRDEHGLKPDLLLITGDLAEWGLRSEFQDALKFAVGLTELLGLGRDRVAIIPGNHDINRKACESYFLQCAADEEQPKPPYWPKWRQYHQFFSEFYQGVPQAQFSEDLPWSLFRVEELKVVIAGLNSTMAESHREEDHYGRVGEAQLRWFRDKLEEYRTQGWLRIGAVHHNVRRGPVADDENLRDAEDLKRWLGGSVNLLLHGHTHDGRLDWLNQKVPILSTGSAALEQSVRPEEVPNQYQVLRIWRNGFCRYTRLYVPGNKGWMGDNRASERGDRWWDEQEVAFADMAGSALEEKTPDAPDGSRAAGVGTGATGQAGSADPLPAAAAGSASMAEMHEALLNAFRSRGELERLMAFHVGTPLDQIAGQGNLSSVVFEMLQWADAHGQTLGLISGARRMNSGNPKLREVARKLGLDA